jgi:hypothetical protein
MSLFDRYPVLKRVIVNTKTGTVIRGLLWQRRGGYLVLKEAELLEPKAKPLAMDGEAAIPEGNVDFLQVVG